MPIRVFRAVKFLNVWPREVNLTRVGSRYELVTALELYDMMRTTTMLIAWLAFGPLNLANSSGRDPHSFSRPDQIRVKDLRLALKVDFNARILKGKAQWGLERAEGAVDVNSVVLDTRDLTIRSVQAFANNRWTDAKYRLAESDGIRGSALAIDLPAGASSIEIEYQTAPTASALQWVDAGGTFGKKHPFLYTQSQAIHARSWVPCQDTPGVRFAFEAKVEAPEELAVVMAADSETSEARKHTFVMKQPIPSYLLALAVGNLEKREIGKRTAVWAEPEIVEKAAWEFADTEGMIEATEARFGPYRWGRYDILVLPPSFPYGGMENPKLTFATPTVLAGDRSQVALIAHELAHSWSGNLATNATWSDFWLNEGFTTYLQNRIVEDVFGRERADMENVLGHGELLEELKRQAPKDQILKLDLDGRDPDEAVTRIAYEKGAAFLKALEAKIGREKLDAFLKGYFTQFAFQSITTAEFEKYLNEQLFANVRPPLDLRAWIHEPGLPAGAVVPESKRFEEIERIAKAWVKREQTVAQIDTKAWTTLEWLHFLRSLPSDLKRDRLAELDAAFHLTDTGNAEVACDWFGMAIRAGYAPADAKLAEFLESVGRRKLIMPLYAALAATPQGKAKARAIFTKARGGYHPIAVDSVEKLLGNAR